MMSLQDRVIVITGAGSGIGRQLAVQFATEKCRLALSDINQKGLDETVALLNIDPHKVASFIVGVSDREATVAFARLVMEKFGQVDVLINNAGLTSVGSIDAVSYEAFERVISVNMWGVVYGCRAFLPYLKERPESVLANVSSINGMVPFADNGPYNMSKYAVYGLNETLMMELRDTSVRVLSIHPGGISTNIVNNSIGADTRTREGFAKLAKTTPEQAAVAIVNAVKNKKRYLFIGRDAKFMQLMKRFSPRLALGFSLWMTARVLASEN